MDPEAIVIGAGPNGLFAACRLARAGLRVLVLEAHDRPGGALWDEARTLPGFRHDVGAGFVAFRDSPAFQALHLEQYGLNWALAPVESAHPALDGTCPAICRDADRSADTMGRDADAWRRLDRFHRRIEPAMMSYLGPIPQLSPALRLRPWDATRLAFYFARSSGSLGRHLFRTAAAQRTIPALGLHVDIGPQDHFGAALAYLLAMRATTSGYAVPIGGASAVTGALVEDLQSHGGTLRLGARVTRVRVRDGVAVGVELDDDAPIDCRGPVVADTSAPALYLSLLENGQVPARVRARMRRFPVGFGTFKVDYALKEAVPWQARACHEAAVVHVGESVQDLARFTRTIRSGDLPEQPYLVVGQHTLVDPSRAPDGQHTLYVYTHVPTVLDPARYPGGWTSWRERLADVITNRIEWLAPGFGKRILARRIADPNDLERANANLIGGDLGGGSNQWWRQLLFRPIYPWYRYRTPVRGLYLGSSYTHPGAGIHGMCGWNAAEMALQDLA